MSSGPSQLCLYSKPSGTILLSIISISSLTSGSQLSFNAKLAEVWRTMGKYEFHVDCFLYEGSLIFSITEHIDISSG